MAATQGHGNPDWTRDETILALHLYQAAGAQTPGPTDPRVIALSNQLRSLPTHSEATRRDSFRNPAGVAFKLQNLRQVATGRGLANVSTVDRTVWEDFGDKPALVQRLAAAIVGGAGVEAVSVPEVEAVDENEQFAEGRILSALHSRRERNPKLRAELVASRRARGALACDCCGRGPRRLPDELALAAFEAHHKTPLAEYQAGQKTTIADLALLCATCHRLIHRAMSVQRRWIPVPLFRTMLTEWGALDVA